MEVITYKLKSGKNKGSVQVPLTDILVERIEKGKIVGLRKLKYVPGSNSIWAEDLPKELEGEQIWIENGQKNVPIQDKLQNDILKIHPFNGKVYEIYNKELEAKKELEALRAKDQVVQLISESDSDKIIATAMAIFGTQAFSWDQFTSELELRKFAESNPKKLYSELNSKTYESKYIAALAFAKGIVRTNLGKTNVIWNDTTEGEILKLARGENGIQKLGDLLSKKQEDTEILLQAISEKIAERTVNVPKQDAIDKDSEIERLKAQIAELQKKSNSELEDLQKAYFEKYDKEVPLRFKNDPEWIQKKLNE